ncbi:MAG: hypothetical protein FJ211_11125, partial [Ignavibacteria bacterium]|nr:hypothetical protein [Ignavibacteria bacterium]
MTIKALSYPTSRPTLDLNFAQTKRLDPRVTFSRSSAGTLHNANGVLQSAATNTARFDHNPATGESLGLLVEEARTNQITYSNTGFQEANVQRFAGLAPDGTFTAALVTNNTSNGNYGSPGAGTFTYSIFVKQGTSTTFKLQYAGYGFIDWTFTFATESFVVSTVAGWTNASMQKLPNGWYRLSATHADRS